MLNKRFFVIALIASALSGQIVAAPENDAVKNATDLAALNVALPKLQVPSALQAQIDAIKADTSKNEATKFADIKAILTDTVVDGLDVAPVAPSLMDRVNGWVAYPGAKVSSVMGAYPKASTAAMFVATAAVVWNFFGDKIASLAGFGAEDADDQE